LYSGVLHINNALRVPDTIPSTSWIPVDGRSSDDVADCRFRAYNMFVNEYRGMDGAQTLFEAGQLPDLFKLWNRRKGIPSNITNGFLNYSFGWRPVVQDLYSVSKELQRLPKVVRGNLKSQYVTRHYRFTYDDTVRDYVSDYEYDNGPYVWNKGGIRERTTDKSRVITVTIRAKKSTKLNGNGQRLLSQLGRYGIIPSIATIWSVTRLSFVVDWFFNIGGAIENLQGSLSHDISNVKICVSDLRTRQIETEFNGGFGSYDTLATTVKQREFIRVISDFTPFIPSLTAPRRPMQYVLLGLIALTSTAGGRRVLQTADRYANRLGRRFENSLIRFFARNPHLQYHQIIWF
jgi:hypothetical protein